MSDEGFELEAKNRLARIGFDRVVGFLSDPPAVMAAHPDRTAVASRLTGTQFRERQAAVAGLQLVDVRHPGEVALGALDGAISIPVGQIPARLEELDADAPTVVYCAGGYRSSVAASRLRQAGFTDVSDIIGGYLAVS